MSAPHKPDYVSDLLRRPASLKLAIAEAFEI